MTKTTSDRVELETTYEDLFRDDFEWTEADEEAAIAQIAADTKIRYIIVEGACFVGRFPDGTIVPVTLKVSLDTILEVQSLDDPLEQFVTLLNGMGEADTEATLRRLDTLSVVDYIEKYFAVFAKVQKASLGE